MRISPAAVSHGTLTVRVEEEPAVIQPEPFSRGQTEIEERSTIEVEQPIAGAYITRGASLSEIVEAINALGASPSDIVAILEALKQAGALTAELVII